MVACRAKKNWAPCGDAGRPREPHPGGMSGARQGILKHCCAHRIRRTEMVFARVTGMLGILDWGALPLLGSLSPSILVQQQTPGRKVRSSFFVGNFIPQPPCHAQTPSTFLQSPPPWTATSVSPNQPTTNSKCLSHYLMPRCHFSPSSG